MVESKYLIIYIVIAAVLGLVAAWLITMRRVSKARRTADELESALGKSQVEVGNLQAEVKALTIERTRLKSEVETAPAERDQLKSELETVSAERDELRLKFESSTVERDGLKSEVETLTAERDELRSQVETLTAERDRLEPEVETLTAERDELRASAEVSRARLDRLEALFQVPSVPMSLARDGLWSTLGSFLDPQLIRLAREARTHALVVGSLETALPIAMEGIDESTARVYAATATTIIDAGETMARELMPSSELGAVPFVSQVSVEIGSELLWRVGRLDSEPKGLFLASVGPLFGLSEVAWGRAMITMHCDVDYGKTRDALVQKALVSPQTTSQPSDRTDITTTSGRPVVEGIEIPSPLASALWRAGVSRLLYHRRRTTPAEEPDVPLADEALAWPGAVTEALRLIRDSANKAVTLRVRPHASPKTELVLIRLENLDWLIARRDVTRADPSQLLEQVRGFVQFQKRTPSP